MTKFKWNQSCVGSGSAGRTQVAQRIAVRSILIGFHIKCEAIACIGAIRVNSMIEYFTAVFRTVYTVFRSELSSIVVIAYVVRVVPRFLDDSFVVVQGRKNGEDAYLIVSVKLGICCA